MNYLKKSWFLTSQTETHGSLVVLSRLCCNSFTWEIHGHKNSFRCVKSGYKIAKFRKTGQNPGVPDAF